MQLAMHISVWAASDSPAEPYWGLYFEAEEANCVINMSKYGSGTFASISLETSPDGTTWTDFDASGSGTTPVTLANIGDKVYFRAKTAIPGPYAPSDKSGNAYRYFTISKKCGCHGNIMSLIDGSNEANTTIPYTFCFYALFDSCANLTSAPDLPATNLKNYCYGSLFWACSSLASAPIMASTANAPEGVFWYAFSGCSSLVSPPSLPTVSGSLGKSCYAHMFENCSSLATAPVLSSMSLDQSCYESMFQGCSSLTTAPDLPATSLPSKCYYWMFYGCTALTTAPATLPSTSVGYESYRGMFCGCTALTTAPEILATFVRSSGCHSMFTGCSNLSTIRVSLTAWPSASQALYYWVDGVAASGTFYCPAALGTDSTITRDAFHCPSGWTVVNI